MSATKITFEQLRHIVVARPSEDVNPADYPNLAAALPSPSSHANLVSALGAFIEGRGDTWNSMIGGVLRAGFGPALQAHVEGLQKEGRTPEYVRNRKHALTRWHKIVRALDHDRASVTGELTPLQIALKKLIADGSLPSVARATAIPKPSLRRWIDGQTPQPSKQLYLTRLEEHFDLEPRSLTGLLPGRVYTAREPEYKYGPADAYRRLLASHVKHQYQLSPRRDHERAVPAQVRSAWVDLMRHKIAADVSIRELLAGEKSDANRARRSWRTRPALSGEVSEERWFDILDGKYVPTARVAFQLMRSYLGWALLPTAQGGSGMSRDDLSLGLFADKDRLLAFLTWRIERSGRVNSGPLTFAQFAGSLCHPQYGFLATRMDIAAHMGIADKSSWLERLTEVKGWLYTDIIPKIEARLLICS